MAPRKKKKGTSGAAAARSKAKPGVTKHQADIPTASTVVEKTTLVSKSGRKYNVLRTTQTDPYDPV